MSLLTLKGYSLTLSASYVVCLLINYDSLKWGDKEIIVGWAWLFIPQAITWVCVLFRISAMAWAEILERIFS